MKYLSIVLILSVILIGCQNTEFEKEFNYKEYSIEYSKNKESINVLLNGKKVGLISEDNILSLKKGINPCEYSFEEDLTLEGKVFVKLIPIKENRNNNSDCRLIVELVNNLENIPSDKLQYLDSILKHNQELFENGDSQMIRLKQELDSIGRNIEKYSKGNVND